MAERGPKLEGDLMKEVIRLYTEEGLGFQAIARRIKVWSPRVREALVTHGVPIRLRGTAPEKEEAIVEDYVRGGLDTEAICRKHSVTDKVVRRLVRERGLKREVQPVILTARQRMKGRTLYDQWVFTHGKEEADRRQVSFAAKCSKRCGGSGNPMYGRASPQGAGNGWKGWYRGTYFRSLRELAYLMVLLESGAQWESGEKKGYRTEYVDWEGKKRTYAPDFAVLSTKTLVEVKPKRLWESPSVKSKAEAGRAWCAARGWQYELTDPVIDTAKVLAAHREGLIAWTPKSRERFDRYYGLAPVEA